MKPLALGIRNLELELEKIRKYVSVSKVMIKMSKVRITSSVNVTDVPIKPSNFRLVVFELHVTAISLL